MGEVIETIAYKSDIINYVYKESKKRRTIGIAVHAGGIVKVTAPFGSRKDYVKGVVLNKAEWIIKHREKLLEVKTVSDKKKFSDGEVFLYLGKEFSIKIMPSSSANSPMLINDVLNIYLNQNKYRETDIKNERIKNAIVDWFKENAGKVIENRVEQYSGRMGILPPDFLISSPKRYWGNCNRKGMLRFNWRIIQAPLNVVDYVVLHELCHLEHFNHSKEFWAKVARYMPDYEVRKKLLKEKAVELVWE